jgi:hypothetical protein
MLPDLIIVKPERLSPGSFAPWRFAGTVRMRRLGRFTLNDPLSMMKNIARKNLLALSQVAPSESLSPENTTFGSVLAQFERLQAGVE